MSARGALRRASRAMSADDAANFLGLATVMRLGTVDDEGWPYVVPLSFVYKDGKVYFHHTAEDSHLTSCLETGPRVCIEVDETGPVYLGGELGSESACDIGRVFKSVIAFGRASLVTDLRAKEQVFDLFVERYPLPGTDSPRTFPKLETTLIFQVEVEVITGKKVEQLPPG